MTPPPPATGLATSCRSYNIGSRRRRQGGRSAQVADKDSAAAATTQRIAVWRPLLHMESRNGRLPRGAAASAAKEEKGTGRRGRLPHGLAGLNGRRGRLPHGDHRDFSVARPPSAASPVLKAERYALDHGYSEGLLASPRRIGLASMYFHVSSISFSFRTM